MYVYHEIEVGEGERFVTRISELQAENHEALKVKISEAVGIPTEKLTVQAKYTNEVK